MYEPKDMFKREIKPGDYITYGVKNSTYINQAVAKILEIIDHGENVWKRARYTFKVLSYRNSWYDPDRTYKTTLISNDTIIRINEGSLPQRVIDLLNAPIV